jgi:16S rRNA processing protein RimM
MIDLSDCSVLGTITKTHGIRGQVTLRLYNLNFEDVIEMESVFIEIDGLPVPFFVSEYAEKNAEFLILTLEDIISEDKAKKLVGCLVYINTNALIKTDKSFDQLRMLLGYEVFDQNYGRLGILDDILDFKENLLFKILNDKKEILVPVQPEFIQNVNHYKKKIVIQTPSGLIDIF